MLEYRRMPGIARRRNTELFLNQYYSNAHKAANTSNQMNKDGVGSMDTVNPVITDENKEVSELSSIPLPNEEVENTNLSEDVNEKSEIRGTEDDKRYYGFPVGPIILVILFLLVLSNT